MATSDGGAPEPWAWLETIADATRLHILRSLSEVAEATAADLAQAPASAQTLRRHLEALVSLRLVVERQGQSDGETPGRPPARFSLHPEIRASVATAFASSPLSAPALPPAR